MPRRRRRLYHWYKVANEIEESERLVNTDTCFFHSRSLSHAARNDNNKYTGAVAVFYALVATTKTIFRLRHVATRQQYEYPESYR